MHHFIKYHSFNIQKYGLNLFFSTSQKTALFSNLPRRVFVYLDFHVLKGKPYFEYLPPDPVKWAWKDPGTNKSISRHLNSI